MTRFNIEQLTEQADTIYVEIDHRFNLAIVRTETGLDLRIYPLTEGELWDAPFTTFTVDESEIVELETDLVEPSNNGGGQ
jgi:hypothetical protein